MKENRKEKLILSLKITAFFLALFGMFYFLYHSPFSYFNNSYGLLNGPKDKIVVVNAIDILDYIYIQSIHILYLFLGEKSSVIIGFHILVRMINCLFVFLCFYKRERMYPAAIVTGIYAVFPFLLHSFYKLDGILIAEFFVTVLLFVVVTIVKAVLQRSREKKQEYKPVEVFVQTETNYLTGEGIKDMEKTENNNSDGLNFLNISDDEIRRNAMIAAGLLPAESPKPVAAEPKINIEKEELPKPNLSHTQFIENPLPVPKRHVKKEMDYEYQVPEDKMHYDIEEPEKNYYDIV